jgi:hypothetical protein
MTAGNSRYEKATPAALRFHSQTCFYSKSRRGDAIEQRLPFGIADAGPAMSGLSAALLHRSQREKRTLCPIG